ncbi:disulfide bond formation protein DsbA [Mesorhizobium sp. NBSH29]|uniref:DsbA family oxidoreductase n=1 Tax=Mesorhizobium sp. NBSH29 TaxID=2654249 RepID=UPI0018967334|nr:DsbA family oxidoreductase [Mesorhizobium sp. NBSH29]QPC87715.1 disulfide bond formation protein DsbA [Mesorhizobium sp. NBSH29]
MTDRPKLSIDIVSDVVCPWCYVGQKRLEAAIAAVPEVDVEIHWRPHQLDATIPPEGKDRKRYMIDKFGSAERVLAMHERITEAGLAEGIKFDFAAIKISPNTLDAHRVLRWAGTAGGAIQNTLKRRLLHLYFEEGVNIGEHSVLIEAARDAGMDASIVETLLPTDADVAEVRTEIETAARMGVTGVPCFLFEGKYAVVGAQDSATLADAIRQIAGAKARGELETAASLS